MEGTSGIIKNSTASRIESINQYCRICTRKQVNSTYGIRIFGRTGLKSILQKFLQLDVSEDDPLPKTICKRCFEKLMAVEYLRAIAKRSETLFKDYLANKSQIPEVSFPNNEIFVNKAPVNFENKPEEVIVDVSMSDPLTKDIKKKLQVAQSKRDSMGIAFSPENLNKNAVTSSPLNQVPVTIVHRMPKKRKIIANPLEPNQIVQIPQYHKTNTTTVTFENPPIIQRTFSTLPTKINPTSPLRHISEAPVIPQTVEIHPVVTENSQVMGQGMPLGSIIKDVDLLKLILKALKWPYNSQTLDIQIQRLKNTNFNDVIVDPNLLQDTDLIKILGPLIAPLPVSMRQPTLYQITIPPEKTEIPPKTMSYKLPAETSVQIITVPASEKEQQESEANLLRKERPIKRLMKDYVVRKKSSGSNFVRHRNSPPPVIVLSDDSDEDQPPQTVLSPEEIPNFGVQLDPAIYPSVGDNSNSNEAMLATLNRQREAMMRMHRNKRKQSLHCAKNVEMVDDIMIVDEGFHMDEPYPQTAHTSVNPLPIASTSHRKTHPGLDSPSVELIRKDSAYTQTTPPLKSSSSSVKSVQPSTEKSNTEEVKYVKLKKDLNLPPLKKVKILPKTAGFIQVKEPSKLICMTKTTTLADADSTTKIVVKEYKIPKPIFESKLSKAKKAANNSESQENVTKDLKSEMVLVNEIQNVCEPKLSKILPEITIEKRKPPVNDETKKKDFKILATIDVSDEEMETLQVEEESSKEQSKEEQSTPTVENKESSSKTAPEPAAGEETQMENKEDLKESETVETSNEKAKEADSIELPEIDIKAEDNEEVEVKEENLESIDDEQTAKNSQAETSTRPQRNFVASKTTIKTEINRSKRSLAKRKVVAKEEEPKEITSFRPVRRSKTMSKYYKGPPLSGSAGRSMRSRT